MDFDCSGLFLGNKHYQHNPYGTESVLFFFHANLLWRWNWILLKTGTWENLRKFSVWKSFQDPAIDPVGGPIILIAVVSKSTLLKLKRSPKMHHKYNLDCKKVSIHVVLLDKCEPLHTSGRNSPTRVSLYMSVTFDILSTLPLALPQRSPETYRSP